MLDEIKQYIKKCPFLKNGKINVNYLSEKAVRYSVEAVPCRPIIRQYVDGGSLRQYIFVFASREFYDEEVLENMKTAKFYEDFSDWLETMSEKNILPEIDGCTATRVETLSTGYVYDASERNARFQVQCRLIYYKNHIK